MPVFAPGEADSISRFRHPSTLSYTYRMPGNLNSSVFGHPTQNTSSKVFQELFGTGSSRKERTERVVINSPHSVSSTGQFNENPTGGALGPGDSDGDDSGNEGGHRPP